MLAIVGRIGTAGGNWPRDRVCRVSAIRGLDMAGRMTVCNMSIEAGARAGLIAPDDTTFDYVRTRPQAPKGDALDQAIAYWRTLPVRRRRPLRPGRRDGRHQPSRPMVSWGTNPEAVLPITGTVPDPASYTDAGAGRPGAAACWTTWACNAGQSLIEHSSRRHLHRQLHQRPHRGHARRRRRDQRAPRRTRRPRPSGPR